MPKPKQEQTKTDFSASDNVCNKCKYSQRAPDSKVCVECYDKLEYNEYYKKD